MATTPATILRCDVCKAYIDDLGYAMVFWNPEKSGTLLLAHKNHPQCDSLAYSAELSWFAEPEAALDRLGSMAEHYKWTLDEVKRLIDIAWAVPRVATDKDKSMANLMASMTFA